MNIVCKCPVCGEQITYTGDTWRDDDWEYARWECKNCRATGIGNFESVFREHTDIKDRDGKDVHIHQPLDLFWVSWIEQDRNGKVRSLAVNEAFTSFELAMKEVKWREEEYGEKLISVWIERHNNGEKIDIPFHRFYVDVFGEKRIIEKPVVIKYTTPNGVVELLYKSVWELRDEYWNDSIDMRVPANDTPIFYASLDGITLENITDFESVIIALGIDKREGDK